MVYNCGLLAIMEKSGDFRFSCQFKNIYHSSTKCAKRTVRFRGVVGERLGLVDALLRK